MECYKKIKEETEKCLIPCKGVFAGVYKDEFNIQVEKMEDFGSILDNYKEYKTGYSKDIQEVLGNFFLQKNCET